MIKGKLIRDYLGDKRTFGDFTLYTHEGKEIWSCFTCEDVVRGDGDPKTVAEWKIKGDSAIPYGIYKVKKTWSRKYDKPVWELQNVPGYTGIRIHPGNTEKDTEGCLLFGKYINANYNGLRDSRVCVKEFEDIMNSIGNPEWEIEICRTQETR